MATMAAMEVTCITPICMCSQMMEWTLRVATPSRERYNILSCHRDFAIRHTCVSPRVRRGECTVICVTAVSKHFDL